MKILKVTQRSACFEISDASPYYSGGAFKVYLNGSLCGEFTTNVFSLFNLSPDSEYIVGVRDEEFSFTTLKETALFSVRSFGAAGDGLVDDTKAFSAALGCLPRGGTLYVPKGRYLVSPLFLPDGATIYLEKGATLIGKTERGEYPVLPASEGNINIGTWQGEEADCFASLVTAYGKSDIKIIGEGVIDCNAQAGDWYVNHRVKRIAWRPRGIFLNGCSNVVLQGITVRNTPSWNIHPYFCNGVGIYNLTLENPPHMPTTDGIDVDCCNGVEIAGVNISVGDDCIALKSGTLEFAKKHKTPCKNVVVRNCLMKSGHGGVVLGSELSGGIEDIKVSRCLFIGTDRGLRIKTRRGRGCVGIVGGITFSDIQMRDVKVPFVINMYYNMGDETGHTEYVYTTKALPVDERTPHIGNFVFRNVVCTNVSYCAGAFYGLPEAPIEGVTFENVSFSYDINVEAGYPDMKEINEKLLRAGLCFQFVDSVTIKNTSFNGAEGSALVTDGIKNISKENVSVK